MKLHTTKIIAERRTNTMHRLPTVAEFQKMMGMETLSSLSIEGKKNNFSVEYNTTQDDFGDKPYTIYINDDIIYGYIEDVMEQYEKFLKLEQK